MADEDTLATVYYVHYVGTLHGEYEYNDDGYSRSGEESFDYPRRYATRKDALAEARRLDAGWYLPDDWCGGPFAELDEDDDIGNQYADRVTLPWPEFDHWLAKHAIPTYTQFVHDGIKPGQSRSPPEEIDEPDLDELSNWYQWLMAHELVKTKEKIKEVLKEVVVTLELHTVHSMQISYEEIRDLQRLLPETRKE